MSLKLAVLAHFDEADTEEAKKMLLDAIRPLSMDVGDAYKDRQRSSSRSAKEAEVEDILHIFKVLDKCKESQLPLKPIFCIDDVKKLPPVAPEAASSRMTILEQLTKQTREMLTIQETLEKMQADIIKNAMDISHMKQGGARQRTYANIAKTTDATAVGPGIEGAGKLPATQVTTADVADAISQINQKETPDGFVTAGRRQKRFNKKSNKGTADDAETDLKGGSDVVRIQITNVHSSITEETIRSYVEKKSEEVKLQTIEDASSPEWETKRFILTFNADDRETIMQDNFWPKKIFYREWFSRRGGGAPKNAFTT